MPKTNLHLVLSILFFLIISLSSNAQSFEPYQQLGVQLGGNQNTFFPGQVGDEYPLTQPTEEYSPGNSFEGGLFYGYYFHSKMGVETGVNFTGRSSTVNGNIERNVYALQLPLVFNLQPTSWFRVGTGFNFNFHLGEPEGVTVAELATPNALFVEWSSQVRFNLDKGFGIGVNFGVGLTPIYQERFAYLNPDNSTSFSIAETTNRYIGVCLYYEILGSPSRR